MRLPHCEAHLTPSFLPTPLCQITSMSGEGAVGASVASGSSGSSGPPPTAAAANQTVRSLLLSIVSGCAATPPSCALTRSPDHSQIPYDALKKAFPKLPDLESFKFMEKEDFDREFWTAAGIGALHRGDVRKVWAQLRLGMCCAALCCAMLCCALCGRIHADALTVGCACVPGPVHMLFAADFLQCLFGLCCGGCGVARCDLRAVCIPRRGVVLCSVCL
jgi:hypothetical protein